MIKGKVYTFGDNIDTDVIIPARYLLSADPNFLKEHCMEDIRPEFASLNTNGDIIVAGENFGCGSSREHAPIAIKGKGIRCVIAATFARIFYRNSINIGLPIIESKEASQSAREGDILEVDVEKGIIYNLTTKESYQGQVFPKFMQEIIRSDGLIGYINKGLENEKR